MDKYRIIVDSREQKPLWKKNIIIKTLNVGDYSINGFEDKISIERKSLSDLFGTLGSGHKRFKQELMRSKSYEFFCIVIEGSITKCLTKDFSGAEYLKMKGEVILKILTTILMKYKIPYFFTNSRKESRDLIKIIFNCYQRLNIEERGSPKAVMSR